MSVSLYKPTLVFEEEEKNALINTIKRKFGVIKFEDESMPEPYSEITPDEYGTLLCDDYIDELLEHAHFVINGKSAWVRIIWRSGVGLATAKVFDPEKRLWSVKFYRIGCQHEFESKRFSACIVDHTCKKCGYTYTRDSSD
jgi:hypothetical protein